MKVTIGAKGLNETWQKKFPKTIKCQKCKGTARIMFVGIEDYPDNKGNFICHLHKTTGKKGGLWVHDVISCAVYLCQDCFEPNVILNQA